MSSDEDRKKPGPDPERLVIEEDPKQALNRLLGKEPNVPEPQAVCKPFPHKPGVDGEAFVCTFTAEDGTSSEITVFIAGSVTDALERDPKRAVFWARTRLRGQLGSGRDLENGMSITVHSGNKLSIRASDGQPLIGSA